MIEVHRISYNYHIIVTLRNNWPIIAPS